jgi:hypothetical protein
MLSLGRLTCKSAIRGTVCQNGLPPLQSRQARLSTAARRPLTQRRALIFHLQGLLSNRKKQPLLAWPTISLKLSSSGLSPLRLANFSVSNQAAIGSG